MGSVNWLECERRTRDRERCSQGERCSRGHGERQPLEPLLRPSQVSILGLRSLGSSWRRFSSCAERCSFSSFSFCSFFFFLLEVGLALRSHGEGVQQHLSPFFRFSPSRKTFFDLDEIKFSLLLCLSSEYFEDDFDFLDLDKCLLVDSLSESLRLRRRLLHGVTTSDFGAEAGAEVDLTAAEVERGNALALLWELRERLRYFDL